LKGCHKGITSNTFQVPQINTREFIFFIALIAFGLKSCTQSQSNYRFAVHDASDFGIQFENMIIESDSVNMLEFTNIYNGAGIGVGDFDNDGKPDLFFAGSIVSSRLYLNKSTDEQVKFVDVTEKSGVQTNRWATGVSVADLNLDGLRDIYVCVSGHKDNERRRNYFFLNQGVDADGIPLFEEKAGDFGIDDDSYSSQAVFFDYDKDGDLDLIIAVNYPENFYGSDMNKLMEPAEAISEKTDRLYENTGEGSDGYLQFLDVSRKAGLLYEGYSLGISVMDINKDSWPDIYLSNDFLSNDLLYINEQNGTFTNKTGTYFKHTTFAGMGCDVADFNNDSRLDIAVLDMIPIENQRRKSMLKSTDYNIFQIRERLGYYPQFNRNTLQMNNGTLPNGDLSFSEIGRYANIHHSDWSWSVLFADLNNNGWKDIFITNGYRRDMQDQDAISDMFDDFDPNKEASLQTLRQKIESAPEVYVSNMLFENQKNHRYKNQSGNWFALKPSFSSGAVILDIEGDGDLDMVASNLNEESFIYINNTIKEESKEDSSNFLKLRWSGELHKKQIYGAEIELWHGDIHQYLQHYPVHGYLSSVDHEFHFGLGADSTAQIRVKMPDGRCYEDEIGPLNTTVDLKEEMFQLCTHEHDTAESKPTDFVDASERIVPPFKHQESEFNDFEQQPLLQRKYSQLGPGLAVGDVNGDELDDFFIGGAMHQNGVIYKQMPNSTFEIMAEVESKHYEDMGAAFFDADGDGDLDLYVCSGGVEYNSLENKYLDRFYLNDGDGHFQYQPSALSKIRSSTFQVNPGDFDADGDIDLFLAGNFDIKNFPQAPRHFLLRNTNNKKMPYFEDVTESLLKPIQDVGMISSSLWTDFDSDGRLDLLVGGEWSPISIFKNIGNGFVDISREVIDFPSNGWWSSINGGDFDQDGDIDYIIGNVGQNLAIKVSQDEPALLISEDLDNDSRLDPVMIAYVKGVPEIIHPRDLLISQLPSWTSFFPDYSSYSGLSLEVMPFFADNAVVVGHLEVNEQRSLYLENSQGEKFISHVLPAEVQMMAVKDIETGDFNNDGDLDFLMCGNQHERDLTNGPLDASIGLVAYGDGHGHFDIKNGLETGLYLNQNQTAVVTIPSKKSVSVLSAANDESLSLFESSKLTNMQIVKIRSEEAYAIITYDDDREEKREFYYAKGYIASSARIVQLTQRMKRMEIYNYNGKLSRSFSYPFDLGE